MATHYAFRSANFPRDRLNPNGSVALGHTFGGPGTAGSRGIVSICADDGQGSVAPLQNG